MKNYLILIQLKLRHSVIYIIDHMQQHPIICKSTVCIRQPSTALVRNLSQVRKFTPSIGLAAVCRMLFVVKRSIDCTATNRMQQQARALHLKTTRFHTLINVNHPQWCGHTFCKSAETLQIAKLRMSVAGERKMRGRIPRLFSLSLFVKIIETSMNSAIVEVLVDYAERRGPVM